MSTNIPTDTPITLPLVHAKRARGNKWCLPSCVYSIRPFMCLTFHSSLYNRLLRFKVYFVLHIKILSRSTHALIAIIWLRLYYFLCCAGDQLCGSSCSVIICWASLGWFTPKHCGFLPVRPSHQLGGRAMGEVKAQYFHQTRP